MRPLKDVVLVGVAGFEPATSASQTRRDNRATLHPEFGYPKKQLQSGWQDSNLRPPRPKRGAITGLRYTPYCYLLAAERPGFEPGQHLRVDRLAICSITTLAPLLFLMNLCNKIADANVPFHWEERKQFI